MDEMHPKVREYLQEVPKLLQTLDSLGVKQDVIRELQLDLTDMKGIFSCLQNWNEDITKMSISLPKQPTFVQEIVRSDLYAFTQRCFGQIPVPSPTAPQPLPPFQREETTATEPTTDREAETNISTSEKDR